MREIKLNELNCLSFNIVSIMTLGGNLCDVIMIFLRRQHVYYSIFRLVTLVTHNIPEIPKYKVITKYLSHPVTFLHTLLDKKTGAKTNLFKYNCT